MAILIRGNLYSNLEQAKAHSKTFYRERSYFNHQISNIAGAEFTPDADRYHLYLGYGDPWSHRVLITYTLLKLQDVISLSVVDPCLTDKGWKFSDKKGCRPNNVNDCDYLYQIYQLSEPEFTGNVSVPVLWDKYTNQIVNTESHDIMRLLNTQFTEYTATGLILYPQARAEEIKRFNEFIFENINNGVYKAGFAPNQTLYSQSIESLFSSLEELNEYLSQSRYLLGSHLTEPDIRLFASLIRFDSIYYPYMKCNRKRIQEYSNLWLYTKDIYNFPGIKETICFDFIMQTYYGLKYLNPLKIIPEPPSIQFDDDIEFFQFEFYSSSF
ncbi:MAG: glutathione S-transferase family protein [Gammaproteobacteria bacterium]|nr:glutathione S-transferase family protein [Gammaproteobacteria bacterium]